MPRENFELLERMAAQPNVLEKTISYAQEHLGKFIRKQDQVLICFPNQPDSAIGCIMEKAVGRLGASVLIWGPDYRWKSLLRQAFTNRISVIIGPPLVILGLAKLAKHTTIPLYIRHAVTAGYPCLDWMIEGIIKGLDCRIWGCFGPGTGPLITGFSCGKSSGVHIRSDEYCVDITDEAGNILPEGKLGEVVLSSLQAPQMRYHTMEQGMITTALCPCGSRHPRLVGLAPGKYVDPSLRGLGAELQAWSSVLDCRLERTEYGLEMELLVFPGEKLPKLPSCAKLIVRSWDPERDVPFPPTDQWKNEGVYHDYY